MTALFISITFIDAEHMIIPLALTWAGMAFGLVANALWPQLSDLAAFASKNPSWKDGLWQSVLGGVIGFFGLWAVVLLGKLAFGRFKKKFEKPAEWSITETGENQELEYFKLDGEEYGWGDLFFRKTDRLIIECATLQVDGKEAQAGVLTVWEDRVRMPDQTLVMMEDLRPLTGTTLKAVIPREAMGMGDVYLMGMIGAFFGWTGVFFALFSSSLYAIVAAILGRVGFGRPLPYGPFLIFGSATWMFGGWKLAGWYFAKLGLGL